MVGAARGPQRADTLKPYSQKMSQSNHTRNTALSNSMKLSHAHGATLDGWVMVERSDRMWSTGEGNGKPLQYSCLENPMNSMKRQNDRILKEKLPRSVGAQCATGWSHHFMGNRWGNNGNSGRLYFWGGSKITADGDCSHEIKRRLLLGRKVMTNLDSILKSGEITLPTKVRLVKAMVFPVVMYGCESWIVKKAESRRIDAFELWC